MCSRFLPSFDKDSHDLCTVCHGQVCDVNLHCPHYETWSVDHWAKVQSYIDELTEQREGKERKALSKSPSS